MSESIGRGATRSLRDLRAWIRERLSDGPPLVSARLRPWVLVTTIVAVCGLVGLGLVVRNSRQSVLFDRRIDTFLVRTSGFEHWTARQLSTIGTPLIFMAITAVVAAVLVLLTDYRAAVAAVLSVGIAVVLVEKVLKPFFDRYHFGISGPSFPSGHAAVSFTLAGAVILAARGSRPLGRALGRTLRRLLMAGVLVVGCAIGLAMVVLQFHYMTDVIAGAPLGLAVAGCTAMVLDAVAGARPSATHSGVDAPSLSDAPRGGAP